jgi:hypothetical protein
MATTSDVGQVTEREFALALADVIREDRDAASFSDALTAYVPPEIGEELIVEAAVSFDDVGLMTSNDGLVIDLSDGSQFQLTVVRSR